LAKIHLIIVINKIPESIDNIFGQYHIALVGAASERKLCIGMKQLHTLFNHTVSLFLCYNN